MLVSTPHMPMGDGSLSCPSGANTIGSRTKACRSAPSSGSSPARVTPTRHAVIAAVRARGFNPADDNEADALAILLWAIETQGGVR